MKRIYQFSLAASFALLVMSCGNVEPKGEIQSKDIELSEFNKLDLNGKFRIFYVQNAHNFVNVETYGNVLDNLDIEVQNKELVIKEKRPTEKVDFYNITIYGKNPFNEVKLSDSVEMNISSQMKVENFSLRLKDNAKFIGSVLSDKAEVSMSNKSKANLLGKTTLAKLDIKDTASIISPYWFIKDLEIEPKIGRAHV